MTALLLIPKEGEVDRSFADTMEPTLESIEKDASENGMRCSRLLFEDLLNRSDGNGVIEEVILEELRRTISFTQVWHVFDDKGSENEEEEEMYTLDEQQKALVIA